MVVAAGAVQADAQEVRDTLIAGSTELWRMKFTEPSTLDVRSRR
jgi:hypothetical protein